MKDVVVKRLHAALAQALRDRGPDALERPVTVAEIYQDLIPYRAVRGLTGVELNADYEHALLRLLAGEGEYARLEPDGARQELELELESPNPNVGLYRKFAACDVWVSAPAAAERAGEVAAAAVPVIPTEHATYAPTPPSPSTPSASATAEEQAVGAEYADGGALNAPPTMSKDGNALASSSGAAPSGTDACPFCAATLPTDRMVRFCPYCGVDQRNRPCPDCGEVLEQGWRYCIACGTSVQTASLGVSG